MEQYISKSALVAEIEKIRCKVNDGSSYCNGWQHALRTFEIGINTLEVKEVDTWHLQEKENIYEAVKDWSLHTFVCIMKDGTIQRFSGILDEDYEGHINVHIHGVTDDYDNVDDIVKWAELT